MQADRRWTADRLSIVLLVIFAAPAAYFLYKSLTSSADFQGFWAAARTAWIDPTLSYDWETARKQLPWLPPADRYQFGYPPPFLALVAPLGLLPMQAAFAVFVVLTLALFLWATRPLKAFWPTLAFPPTLVSIVLGQNGLLTGGLFIGAMRLLDRRPALAGALIGALVIKPQLAILTPVALIAGGRWRAVAGAAASSLGLLAISWLIFGSAVFTAFIQSASDVEIFLLRRSLQLKMQTPFALVSTLGGAPQLAMAAQAVSATIAACVVAYVWRKDLPTDAKCAVLASATALATPYLYPYDMTLLLAPILWLGCQQPTRWERVVIAVAFLSPLASHVFAMTTGTFNPGPLVHVVLLLALLRRVLATKAAAVRAPA